MLIDTREDAKWTVYVHIVPKAISGYDYDKYYVGITSQSPKNRWGKNGNVYKRSNQIFFDNAINKYGWNNMDHIVLASHLTESEAKDMERVLIKQLDSYGDHGYNLTFGGDGMLGVVPKSSKRIHIFKTDGGYIESHDSFRFIKEKYHISESRIKTAAKSKRQILDYFFAYDEDVNHLYPEGYEIKNLDSYQPDYYVYQFDFEGKYINRFSSAKEAARISGCGVSEIYSQVSEGKEANFQCHYIWKTNKDVIPTDSGYAIKDFTPPAIWVYQFDFDGNLMERFDSIAQVAEKYDLDRVTIWKHMTGQMKRYGKNPEQMFTWRYLKDVKVVNGEYRIDPIHSYFSHKPKEHHDKFMIKIYQFDLKGNFIAEYPSMIEAALATNACTNTIRKFINGKATINLQTRYIWADNTNVTFTNGTYKLKTMPPSVIKYVFGFRVDGTFIGKFESTRAAARATGESNNNIEYKLAHRTINKNSYQTLWRFSEDVQELPDGSFLMLR